jgi:hypothetical protein
MRKEGRGVRRCELGGKGSSAVQAYSIAFGMYTGYVSHTRKRKDTFASHVVVSWTYPSHELCICIEVVYKP